MDHVAAAVLGIGTQDAILLELACQSCDDEPMRLVSASPRSVTCESAAQVLSADASNRALRAWIASTLAERMAEIYQQFADQPDKSSMLYDVVQEWTSGGTSVLSNPAISIAPFTSHRVMRPAKGTTQRRYPSFALGKRPALSRPLRKLPLRPRRC